jgi:hypothetical protein
VDADQAFASNGTSYSNSCVACASGRYFRTTLNIDHPVDEWLYGVARVRPMMRAWESTTLLAGALGQPEPSLRVPQEVELLFRYLADSCLLLVDREL